MLTPDPAPNHSRLDNDPYLCHCGVSWAGELESEMEQEGTQHMDLPGREVGWTVRELSKRTDGKLETLI